MIRAASSLLIAAALAIADTKSVTPVVTPQENLLPKTAELAYLVLDGQFDRDAAMEIVGYMQQYWRIAGNPGFNASIDHLRDRLTRSGFRAAPAGTAPFLRVDEFQNPEPGWDYAKGTVWLDGDEVPILSRERDRVSLAINSFSTPQGGARLRVVDVGSGNAEADFAGKDLKGALVLGDAPIGRLWQQAVRSRGAAGVVSTQIAPYIRPSDPASMSEAQKDVLQWGTIPYDPKLSSFGFKASWRAAERLRQALKRDPGTMVRVEIESKFHEGPNRTLVAEIPGSSRPDERIVLAAHVQEPGANDDASGCATLFGIAAGLARAIKEGRLPAPNRTLTFLWVDEIRGSRHWITSRPQESRGVQYMFSLDMTGEDTTKTGGTFLIEKEPDPTAVWQRPSDPHSEWGATTVKPETLKGSILNDLHIAVANRRARQTGWIVRTNPYEGGSDHTPFLSSGVPSLLNWHFTDRFYHTNQDTIDRVSSQEMEHVALIVATSAYFLAAASEIDAEQMVGLLERAAMSRLALERRQGEDLIAKASDKAAATRTEQQVIGAWKSWYLNALDSIARLPVPGPGGREAASIAAAKNRIEQAFTSAR